MDIDNLAGLFYMHHDNDDRMDVTLVFLLAIVCVALFAVLFVFQQHDPPPAQGSKSSTEDDEIMMMLV